jgi:uncharacterized membrane protein
MRQRFRAVFGRANHYVRRALEETDRRADRLIFVPIIVYTVFFSVYMCYMHYIFKTFAWDLGIIEQSLWTTLNSGKIMYSTLEVPFGNPTGNFLGVHFSPILFLVLPIYALYQSPQTLLVFQSFILAIAALPLYWLARDKLHNRLYGLAFATAYLLNPALHGVNTFDVHLEIFTPVFFLFAFYYLDKGKWLKALPFIILELATIEFAPFIVFPLGLYFFLKRSKELWKTKPQRLASIKKLLFPIAIMIASIVCLYLSLRIIELINPLKTGGAPGRWENWGTDFSEAATNIIRNPREVLIVLATPIEKPYFIIFLFASVIFLPLFAPLELIMPLPWIVAALLTDYSPYYQPIYQYPAFILGQISIAAIYGYRRLFSPANQTNEHSATKRRIIVAMLLLNVFMFLAISPVGIPAFTSRGMRPYAFGTEADLHHVEELYKVLSLIPSNASVATIHEIFPHLCQRLHAYCLKWPLDYAVDYILVDVKSPTYTWVIEGPTPDQIIVTVMESREYGVIASCDGVILLERGYNGSLKHYTPQIDVFNYDKLIPSSLGKIRWDYTSTSGRIITSDPSNSAGMIWFGPYRYFSVGTYSATFRLKTANETCQLLLEIATNQGTLPIAKRAVNGTAFNQLNAWQEFSLHFEIGLPTKLEFRGFCSSNNTQVAIDFVKIEQLAP